MDQALKISLYNFNERALAILSFFPLYVLLYRYTASSTAMKKPDAMERKNILRLYMTCSEIDEKSWKYIL